MYVYLYYINIVVVVQIDWLLLAFKCMLGI